MTTYRLDLVLPFTPELFPFVVGDQAPTITHATIYARWGKIAAESTAHTLGVSVVPPSASPITATLSKTSEFGKTGYLSTSAAAGTWTMTVTSAKIAEAVAAGFPAGLYTHEGVGSPYHLNDTLEDVWIVFEYTQPVPSVDAWA